MIESDVMLRGQDTESQSLVPIMAEYPNTDSDLTFDEWLEKIIRTTNKGVKIHFQSIDAVEYTLQKLKDAKASVRDFIDAVYIYYECFTYKK